MKHHAREHMVILFIVGVLALNYPILSSVNRLALFLGIPLLYFYVFLAWLAIIVLMACIVECSGQPRDDKTES